MNPWRPNSPLSGMPLIKDGVHSKRESSYDRTGANRDFVRVETARPPRCVTLKAAAVLNIFG